MGWGLQTTNNVFFCTYDWAQSGFWVCP